MTEIGIKPLRAGLLLMMLSIVLSAVISWFAFPWWSALIISVTNAISLMLFIRVAFTLEKITRDSNSLLREIKRVYDEVVVPTEQSEYLQ